MTGLAAIPRDRCSILSRWVRFGIPQWYTTFMEPARHFSGLREARNAASEMMSSWVKFATTPFIS